MRRAVVVMTRAGWLLVRLVLVLAGLRVSLAVVGLWPTAAGLAAASLGWGLSQWQRLERWLDARERRLLAVDASLVRYVANSPGPGGAVQDGEHVEFARALAAVSARYLAHCEDQADEHATASGEGWR
jgi:hypothetical protein